MGEPGRRRIYLMRHGHVDYFASDLSDPRGVPLTDEGRRQADAAGRALANIDFEAAFFSGLPRTQETAEIVLKFHSNAPSLEAVEDLEELKSGWIKADSREKLAAWLAYSFDGADADGATFLPEGELFTHANKRVVRGIETIILQHSFKNALVVAHEGVNRLLLSWVTGGGLKTIAAFEQDLACVNVIDIDVSPAESGGGLHIERAVLRGMNITPYDYVKKGLSRSNLEHLFGVDFGGVRPEMPELPKMA